MPEEPGSVSVQLPMVARVCGDRLSWWVPELHSLRVIPAAAGVKRLLIRSSRGELQVDLGPEAVARLIADLQA